MATAADVLAVAMKEIGTVEQSGNRQKYGKAYGMDGVYWCMRSSGGAFSRRQGALYGRRQDGLLRRADALGAGSRSVGHHGLPARATC